MNTAAHCGDNNIAAGCAGGYDDGGGGGGDGNGGAAAAATVAASDVAVKGEASPTNTSWLKCAPSLPSRYNAAALPPMTMKTTMVLSPCNACQQVADPRRSTCYAFLQVQVLSLNYVQT